MRRLALMACCSVAFAFARGARAETVVPGGEIATQTWTTAGGPYRLLGDITIPVGSTLTIEPGVAVVAADGDDRSAGWSATRVELTVFGALVADGTRESPVTFTGSASGSWYGIDIRGAGSVLDNVFVSNSETGIRIATTGENTYSAITVQDAASAGALIVEGNPTLDGFSSIGAGDFGVEVTNASATLRNCVLTQNLMGIVFLPSSSGRVLTVDHCTLAANSGYALDAGSSQASSVAVTSSIVTGSNFGVYAYGTGMAASVTYSDVWGNSTNFSGATAGTGTISADPLFVSSSDFHLQEASPCVDAGTADAGVDPDGVPRPIDGDRNGTVLSDMGAYEFVPQNVCGNGTVEWPEQCDDGNTSNADACLNTCVVATCGDGFVLSKVEQCDDGNLVSGDGCSSTCTVEHGHKH